MKPFLILLGLLPITELFAQDCSELFISEYVEGAGSNKAIEIFNPGSVPVLLDNYSIRIYFNGATDTSGSVRVIGLRGSLPPAGAFVLADDGIDSFIYNFAEIDTFYSGGFLFNGDDAIALFNDDLLVDVIGYIGVDPDLSGNTDTGFSVGGGSTVDHTLQRKQSVRGPSKIWSAGTTDWYAFPMDSASTLGGHANCCFSSLAAELSAIPSQLNQLNGSVSATASGGVEPYEYLWSNGAAASLIQNLAPGLYKVTLTDAAGCDLKDSAWVEILDNVQAHEDGWSVQAELVGRNLQLQLSGNGSLELNLFDLMGQHHLSTSLLGPGYFKIGVGHYASGVYLLRLKLGEKVQVRKLILK